MLNMDAPDHGRLRRLVAAAFVPVADRRPARRRSRARRRAPRRTRSPPDPVPWSTSSSRLRPRPALRRDLRAARRARRPTAGACTAPSRRCSGRGPVTRRRRPSPRRTIVAYLPSWSMPSAGPRPATSSSVLVAPPTATRSPSQELLSSLFQLVVAGHDTTSQPHRQRRGRPARPPRPAPGAAATTRAGCPPRSRSCMRFTAPVPHATFRVTTEAGRPRRRGDARRRAGAGRPGRRPTATRAFVDARPPRRHPAPGRTSRSATGPTTAWARRSPGWRPRSPSSALGRFPDLRLAVGPTSSPGPTATASSSAASPRSPSCSAARARPAPTNHTNPATDRSNQTWPPPTVPSTTA